MLKLVFTVVSIISGFAVMFYGFYLFLFEVAPDLASVIMIFGGFALFLSMLLELEATIEAIRMKRRGKVLRRRHYL